MTSEKAAHASKLRHVGYVYCDMVTQGRINWNFYLTNGKGSKFQHFRKKVPRFITIAGHVNLASAMINSKWILRYKIQQRNSQLQHIKYILH